MMAVAGKENFWQLIMETDQNKSKELAMVARACNDYSPVEVAETGNDSRTKKVTGLMLASQQL